MRKRAKDLQNQTGKETKTRGKEKDQAKRTEKTRG
jgi:hypothetical protein